MATRNQLGHIAFGLSFAVATIGQSPDTYAEDRCLARSTDTVPVVVELYTSEGCSSCPPADRWLSALKSDRSIVAMAFHVDYWDRLGWKDRFASPIFTQRQANEQARNGAAYSYTPQVVVAGEDSPRWYRDKSLGKGVRDPALVDVQLERSGVSYTAVVTAQKGAPSRLEAFWVVTEDDHQSNVKAGENKGVTLSHDFVVREYLPVKAWSTQQLPAAKLKFDLSREMDSAHPRFINLVIRDAKNGRPVQALKLGC